MTSEVCRLK